MTFIASSHPNTSSDHDSNGSASLAFKDWIAVLSKEQFTTQDETLFLQGLHDHPEWLNQTDRYQRTPLIKASEYGHVEIAQALILAGANPHLQDQSGCTALTRASMCGQVEIVQALIQAGVDLNLHNRSGWTALMLASSQGYLDVVMELAQHGANLEAFNRDDQTALDQAKFYGHLTVVDYLEAYSTQQTMNQTLQALDPVLPPVPSKASDHYPSMKTPRL